MTLPLESSGKKSDLEFVLLGGKVLSQEWMTHFVNVYKHHYLVVICCFWKINSASKSHFYDFFFRNDDSKQEKNAHIQKSLCNKWH